VTTGLDYAVNSLTKSPPVVRFLPKWRAAWREQERMKLCGTHVNFWKHNGCDSVWTQPITCNSRWCPRCARRRADQLVDRYLPSLYWINRAALVTLTVPNCWHLDLSLHLTVLVEAWSRLRRSKVWTSKRGISSIEIKFSEKKGFHPHIHVLAEWTWTDLRTLSLTWQKLTEKLFAKYGRSVQVLHQPQVDYIRNPDKLKALGEVCKYACGVKRGEMKSEYPKYPADVQVLITAVMAGTRMVNAYGKLHPAKRPRYKYYCPNCGAEYHSWNHASNWHREVMPLDMAQAVCHTQYRQTTYDGWEKELIKGDP